VRRLIADLTRPHRPCRTDKDHPLAAHALVALTALAHVRERRAGAVEPAWFLRRYRGGTALRQVSVE
jgi:hypothetical protein